MASIAQQLQCESCGQLLSPSTVAIGPLHFDNEMARGQGWTEHEIDVFWDAVTTLYRAAIKKEDR